jgi:hypothetical protein
MTQVLPAERGAPPMSDLDGTGDAIVTIPHPAWKLVLVALLAFAVSILPAIKLRALLNHDPAVMQNRSGQVLVTGPMRWFYIGVFSVFAMVPLPSAVLYAKRPEFAIEKTGIRVSHRGVENRNLRRGVRKLSELAILPWGEVRYCHWGRNPPGLLNIQVSNWRLFVRIPERFRAEVEKALRAFGKWQE